MGSSVEVRTKEELESAVKSKVERIIVKGDLAEKLHRAEAIKKVSKPALVILGAAIAAMPFTGGVSGAVGLVGITTTTGLSIAAITAIVPNNRLLSPLRGWDGISAAPRLQARPKAGALAYQTEISSHSWEI